MFSRAFPLTRGQFSPAVLATTFRARRRDLEFSPGRAIARSQRPRLRPRSARRRRWLAVVAAGMVCPPLPRTEFNDKFHDAPNDGITTAAREKKTVSSSATRSRAAKEAGNLDKA